MSKYDPTVPVTQDLLGLFDAVSFLASLASLILAVVAIFLAIAYKRSADKVNTDTSNQLIDIKTNTSAQLTAVQTDINTKLTAVQTDINTKLIEIKIESQVISKVVVSELSAYGAKMRSEIGKNQHAGDTKLHADEASGVKLVGNKAEETEVPISRYG